MKMSVTDLQELEMKLESIKEEMGVRKYDPVARKHFELQQAVDGSLNRSFEPPVHEALDARSLTEQSNFRMDAARPESVHQGGRAMRWQRYALAALLALVAGGGAWWWASQNSGGGSVDPTYRYKTFLTFYDASAQNDFKEDWVCESPSEFAATFHARVGFGLRQPDLPAGVELLGLKYGYTITGLTVHIMAKVDGAGVIVFVDKKSRDPSPEMQQGDLNVFRRELAHLVLYEMTPHDKASILPHLEEREVQPEEVKRFYQRQRRPS